MSFRIRMARPADAEALLAIYAPFVTDTDVSFEFEVPSVDEFARRIEAHVRSFAHLVVEEVEGGRPLGFAYYSTFRDRPAYSWAAEISVYLAPEAQGRGLGRVLLETLEACMRAQGIRMSEACITSTNTASIAFHERMGYTVCGEHHACGFKRGAWLSVTWMEKQLMPLDAEPAPVTPLTTAQARAIIEQEYKRRADVLARA